MKNHSFRSNMALALALIAVLTLTAVYPAAAETATVTGGWLILRASPSFSAKSLASYPTGTVVTITGQNGSWYAVTAPDGMNGWMYGTYLKLQGSSSGGGTGSAKITSKNGLNVRLRTGAGTGYTVLGSYPPGTQVKILSSGKEWSKVQIGSLTGYIMSQYLTGGSGGSTPNQEFKPTTLPVPSNYKVWVTSNNGQGVNFREGPSQNYTSIGLYNVGTEATMTSLGNTWSYIRIGDKYGYMMTKFLTATEYQGGGEVEPVVTGAHVVSGNGKSVNLRTAPGKSSEVIRSYPVGTALTIITKGDEWYFIQIGNDYGYMMKKFIAE